MKKQELEMLNLVFEKYNEPIISTIKKKGHTSLIQILVKKITERNQNVLLNRNPGVQLLINEDAEDEIFRYYGIRKRELERDIKENPFYKSINLSNRIPQLAFAVPLLLISRYLYEQKKEKEAKMFYLFCFYKPYASVVSKYYKYTPNEDRMRYTIENLSNKFPIKVKPNIQSVLEDMSNTSFNNYTEKNGQLLRANDKDLYDVFVAGIYSRINQMMKNISRKYYENDGKYLPYEYENLDSESEDYRHGDSVSKQKGKIVNSAATQMVKNPIDLSLVEEIVGRRTNTAGKRVNIYNIDVSQKNYVTILKLIKENNYEEFQEMFDAILGYFLLEKQGTVAEVRSPKYRKIIFDIYKSSNSSSENIKTIKRLVHKWASQSNYYLTKGNTQKNKMTKAIYAYFAFYLQRG